MSTGRCTSFLCVGYGGGEGGKGVCVGDGKDEEEDVNEDKDDKITFFLFSASCQHDVYFRLLSICLPFLIPANRHLPQQGLV